MIPANAIRGIRPVIERALPYRCTILRAATATPRPGYETETFAAHLEDVPCFRSSGGRPGFFGGERQTTDRLVSVDDWFLTVPHGTDVTEGDRISEVTAFGETILSSADGVEIVKVSPIPGYITLTLRKVD